MRPQAAGRPWAVQALVAGVDEAGRGPLAGPVVAAAVILDPGQPIMGLRDSKQLTARARERLAVEICRKSRAWAIGCADAGEIDVLDVLQASLLAMRRALQGLPLAPAQVRIDGNRAPATGQLGFSCAFETIVGGDAIVAEISAASILAKVSRDRWMTRAALAYPQYAFEQHKGYPTALHLDRLARHGACRLHRRSFAPVRSRHAVS